VNLRHRETRLLAFVPVLIAIAGCQPKPAAVDSSDMGMSQFSNDKDFHAAHTLAPAENKPIEGKDIQIKVGEGTAKAYWVPPQPGHTEAVLMVHEWWGLNANIRQTADTVNKKAGYGVLAIDLYGGKVATNGDDAQKYMDGVDKVKGASTINAALKALKNGVEGGPPATKIGTIGFCFGGGWSHKAAIMGGDNVQACVIFYGMPSMAPAELERLKAPVLFVSGKQDKWITPEVVSDFKRAMESAGKPMEAVEYDADHAFANPSSKSYKSKEAQEAWDKTFDFFKKNLG